LAKANGNINANSPEKLPEAVYQYPCESDAYVEETGFFYFTSGLCGDEKLYFRLNSSCSAKNDLRL